MTKLIFLLPIYFLFLNCSFGQKTKLWSGYESGDKTSLGIATSMREAVSLLEKVAELMVDEKEFSFGISRGFSSTDTILELVRIDYEKYHPYQERYVVNLSTGLSISTYHELLNQTQNEVKRGHYIFDGVFDYLRLSVNNIFELHVMRNDAPKGQEQEYYDFFKKVILLSIKNGNIMLFETYSKYINNAMLQAGLEQLKDPKWPPQYIEQYMEDKRDEWNPARIDTTGIPQKYFADKYIKYNACPPSSVDSLCWDYVNRIRLFQIFEQIGEEQGITPQEALYNEVKNRFYYQGYKEFHYMISYAIKHEDELLLDALREFVKKHPDYEVPQKWRQFYEDAHQFVIDNR